MTTKRLIATIAIAAIAATTIASCGRQQGGDTQKRGSSGKTLEVLMAVDRDLWNGTTTALVDSLFRAPQDGLPQPEPKFSVVNIPTSSLQNTEMFQNHRNILLCDVKADNPNKVYIHHNVKAYPQVWIEFAVASRQDFERLLRQHYPRIEQEIYNTEHLRIQKAFYATRNVPLMADIRRQFGFGLTFSDEFAMAKQAKDFAWVRKEAKDFGIGVLIAVEPYQSQRQLSQEAILDRLDTLMRHHVPGPADGSYMATERRAPATTTTTTLGTTPYALQTRGCWRLFGDFMGGPYVAYTALNPAQDSIITLTAYAYCPRFPKRDYIMQVESICHSITFGDNQTQPGSDQGRVKVVSTSNN
ncbi:MAG: DUF4837 family protein [Bacteroidales bacterium]|nr:DUF4837 family protein [Bacteroidales bacterium]